MVPRSPLSRDRVLRAALKLADAAGTDGLTMRRLGEALEVEAMSLYKHVANKDAILDGIVDLVVGEISLPTVGDPWLAEMRQRAVSAHEVLRRHPWSIQLLLSRVNVGPSMIRYTDATIGTLRRAGFSVALADHALNAMDSHIYGFTMQQLHFPFEPEQYAQAAEQFLPLIPAEDFPHLAEMAKHVIDGRYSGILEFTFGLDLILEGLERLRRKESPRRR